MKDFKKASIFIIVFLVVICLIVYITTLRTQNTYTNTGIYTAKNDNISIKFTVYDQYQDYQNAAPESLVDYNTKQENEILEENQHGFVSGTIEVKLKGNETHNFQNSNLEIITTKGKIIQTLLVYEDLQNNQSTYIVPFVADVFQEDELISAIFCLDGIDHTIMLLQKL